MNEIPSDAARWIVDLVENGWRPSIPPFSELRSVQWNGCELPVSNATTRLQDDRLVVEMETGLNAPGSEKSSKLILRLSDGSEVNDPDPFVSHRSTELDMKTRTGVCRTACTLLDWSWHLTEKRIKPAVWFASVQGRLYDSANVVVHGRRAEFVAARGLWLEGADKRYFLIGQEPEEESPSFDMLIFDVDDASRAALGPDHRALEFCLGRRLAYQQLIGVDSTGTVVEVRGTRIGSVHHRRQRIAPAVPLKARHSWIAPMFSKLSRAQATRPELALHVPLAYYVESIGQFVDLEFLAVQIALEAFATALTKTASAALAQAVDDKVAWRRWVKAHADEIRAFAVQGQEDSLLNRVFALSRRATGRVIEDAFGRFGKALLPEQNEVIEDRNLVAHTALMTEDGAYDFPRELHKIAIARVMVVALIALSIGYRGQIRGWQQPDRGDGTPPIDWWPTSPEDEETANTWFRASPPGQ